MMQNGDAHYENAIPVRNLIKHYETDRKSSHMAMMKRDPATDQLENQHQNQKMKAGIMTHASGAPVGSRTTSMKVGCRGPIVLQDTTLIETLAHFDRERIPERVVHAKGAGAHGVFEVTNTEITKYTKAKVFSTVGKKTPLFIRFSTVGGESGSADTARDPRGFAIKFYTEEGNWDLVGNNTPIFFIRDPILFPSFIHTQKRNPVTNLPDADMAWDFWSLRPESIHQVMFLFSDRGTPDGYRFMNGYGSHTFKLVNGDGEQFYCKFHLKTNQGIRNLINGKADDLAGSDPNYATRDLYDAIEKGDFPSWKFCIQIMTLDQAANLDFNPFDLTKIWSHKQFPLIPVGQVTLNRNPINYFAEVEQAAFSPSHFVPGIEASPDPMLQGRLFSYPDTHRHRLGVNHEQIPINAPKVEINSYHKAGQMNVTDNGGGAPNYYPNSFSGAEPVEHADQTPYSANGKVARFEMDEWDNDFYSQPRAFWNEVLTPDERERLVQNLANGMGKVLPRIQERAIENFTKVDQDFGDRLRAAIKPKPVVNGYMNGH